MNRIFQVGYAQFCSGHHWNISIFRRGPSTAKLHNQGTWTNKSQEAQTFASRKVPKTVWVVTLLLQNRTQRMYVHFISYHAPRCATIFDLLFSTVHLPLSAGSRSSFLTASGFWILRCLWMLRRRRRRVNGGNYGTMRVRKQWTNVERWQCGEYHEWDR